jgi:hypothetical protein
MRQQLPQRVIQAMGLMVVIMEELMVATMMMDNTVRAITVDIMTMDSTTKEFMVDITTMDNTTKSLMAVIMLELMLGIMLQPPLL